MYIDPTPLSLCCNKTTDDLNVYAQTEYPFGRNKHRKILPWNCVWNILHKLNFQLHRFLCCVWQRWLSLHLLFF